MRKLHIPGTVPKIYTIGYTFAVILFIFVSCEKGHFNCMLFGRATQTLYDFALIKLRLYYVDKNLAHSLLHLQGFDEYMNLVLNDAEKINVKNTRK